MKKLPNKPIKELTTQEKIEALKLEKTEIIAWAARQIKSQIKKYGVYDLEYLKRNIDHAIEDLAYLQTVETEIDLLLYESRMELRISEEIRRAWNKDK